MHKIIYLKNPEPSVIATEVNHAFYYVSHNSDYDNYRLQLAEFIPNPDNPDEPLITSKVMMEFGTDHKEAQNLAIEYCEKQDHSTYLYLRKHSHHIEHLPILRKNKKKINQQIITSGKFEGFSVRNIPDDFLLWTYIQRYLLTKTPISLKIDYHVDVLIIKNHIEQNNLLPTWTERGYALLKIKIQHHQSRIKKLNGYLSNGIIFYPDFGQTDDKPLTINDLINVKTTKLPKELEPIGVLTAIDTYNKQYNPHIEDGACTTEFFYNFNIFKDLAEQNDLIDLSSLEIQEINGLPHHIIKLSCDESYDYLKPLFRFREKNKLKTYLTINHSQIFNFKNTPTPRFQIQSDQSFEEYMSNTPLYEVLQLTLDELNSLKTEEVEGVGENSPNTYRLSFR